MLMLNQGDEAHAAPAALACGKIIAECATEKLEEGVSRRIWPEGLTTGSEQVC
ncbi:MAG: hypothetical protein ABIS92_13220 [Polyangia bacterium]